LGCSLPLSSRAFLCDPVLDLVLLPVVPRFSGVFSFSKPFVYFFFWSQRAFSSFMPVLSPSVSPNSFLTLILSRILSYRGFLLESLTISGRFDFLRRECRSFLLLPSSDLPCPALAPSMRGFNSFVRGFLTHGGRDSSWVCPPFFCDLP